MIICFLCHQPIKADQAESVSVEVRPADAPRAHRTCQVRQLNVGLNWRKRYRRRRFG